MSLKKNYMYNLMRILNQALFPLITFPYISKTLGVNGIGKIEYITSISAYGLMIAIFGISEYGSLEIAKYQNDTKGLRKESISLFNCQILTTLIGVILYIFLVVFLGIEENLLIFIYAIKIIFNLFKVDWYYRGTEQFRYITTRDAIVRILFLIYIFTFIGNSGDYLKYALAVVLGEGLGNLFNFYKMKKDLSIKTKEIISINLIQFKEKIVVIFPYFFSALSVVLYLNVDKTMLGSFASAEYVGYYSISNKIIRIITALVTVLTTSISPKLSFYFKNDRERYLSLLRDSINLFSMLIFPMIIGVLITSRSLLLVILGSEYLPALSSLRILSFLMLTIACNGVLGVQILSITGNMKKYSLCILITTILNIILNIILIPNYYHIGAAIASIISEIIGLLFQLYFVVKVLREINVIKKLKLAYKTIFSYILSSLIMVGILIIIREVGMEPKYELIIQILGGILTYFFILYLTGDYYIRDITEKIKRRRNGK